MYKTPEETLAERLLRMIQSRNDSVSSFAKKCGIGESLVRKYIAGSQPSAANLLKMADELGFTMDWLAAGREPMPRSPEPDYELILPDFSFENILLTSFSKMNIDQKNAFIFLFLAIDNPGQIGKDQLAESAHCALVDILTNAGFDLIPRNN